MARIEQADLSDTHFEVPKEFSAQELLAPVFGRYAGDGKVQTVRLLFDKSVADWVTEREWHPRQVVKWRRDGAVELSFPAKGLQEVQRWVLGWGASVRVLGPTELAERVHLEVRAMSQRKQL
ncbi:MAG: WYL domain-containing protein [Lentisphaerae bacterium]|nr:WYL domain-containing protein [Lentisphaerota bacterium]